jgi:hypothetical protein
MELLPIIKETIISLCTSRTNEVISRNVVIDKLLENSKIKKAVKEIKNQKNQDSSKIVGNMVDFLNAWVTRFENGSAPSTWFGFASDFHEKIERKHVDGKWAYSLRSSNLVKLTNYWMFVGNNQENMTVHDMFERNMKLQYWGFKEGTSNTLQIRIGDRVIIYLAGSKMKFFVASCRLNSNYLNKTEAQKKKHDFPGVELAHINIWSEPKINTDSLREKLSFIKDKTNPGLAFHASIIKITEDDYKTINGTENEELDNEYLEIETESMDSNPPDFENPKFTHAKIKKRSKVFSQKVKENYNFSCAICRRRRFANGNPEVESAHIFSRKHNGPNIPQNGLALCKFHHWAFDNGLFSIADDYSILVSETIAINPEKRKEYEEITAFEGKKINPPKVAFPHKKFLKKHRKEHGFKLNLSSQ